MSLHFLEGSLHLINCFCKLYLYFRRPYVYIWADGIYCDVRMENCQCLMVIIGAMKDGKKELIALDGGVRESELSWTEILVDLKRRGLKDGPELAVGDGALGFWSPVKGL